MSKPQVKILYPFEGATVGGGPISALEIITSLDKTQFSPICLINYPKGPLENYLKSKKVDHQVLKLFVPHSLKELLVNPICFVKSIFQAYQYIKKENIDIVQTDDGPMRYIWFYAAKIAKVPYVLTQVTLLRQNVEKKISYRFMDAIISNSEATQETLPDLPNKIIQGISYPTFEKNNPICIKKNDAKITIGYLSSLYKQKRPEIFLEIAAILNAKYPNKYNFIMVGGYAFGMENKITKLIKNCNLDNNISLKGFVNDPIQLLNEFHILIAPSVREAFGRNLVEAMSLGIPVVATDDGGHKEIIENGISGFLVEKENSKMFAEKVENLLNDKLYYNKVSMAAKERSKKFCDINPAPLFENIYNKILSN